MNRPARGLAAHPRRQRRRLRPGRADGAILFETLIAFLPLLLGFFAILQLLELFAANLITQRAASAAIRAAVVVMPDNPQLYPCGAGQTEQNGGAACKREDVERAAQIVLQSAYGFRGASSPSVELDGTLSGHNLVTAQVDAPYRCHIPLIGTLCGEDREVTLSAQASLPYQEAGYDYAQ